MNIHEAQLTATREAGELLNDDISVRFIPKQNKTGKKNSELPQRFWLGVSFDCSDDKTKMQKVFDAEDRLKAKGITFDTGGGCGSRDWELDWSLGAAA